MLPSYLNLVFQIIAALGSIATFGAFLMLFKKDKEKQNQIDKLTKIATLLDSQNDTLRQQNDLISQQVDIFRNTNILKSQDDNAIKELKKIEEKKLLLSVKPNLWINGAGYNGNTGELKIDLNNKGEYAKLIDFKNHTSDIILHSLHLPYDLHKGERRFIFGRQSGKKPIKDCDYEIEIMYLDKLENRFSIIIKGKGAEAKIIDEMNLFKKPYT